MADRPNFRDTEHLYSVFEAILRDLFTDQDIGPKLRDTGLIVQWVYSDPDAVVTFNLRDKPREGYYADWAFGETDWVPDVTTYQTASFGLAFLQGMENPMVAVTRGKVKAKGKISALMKMIPISRPLARRVRKVLYTTGEEDLVIPSKKKRRD